jgi:hypothetical protein
VSDEQPTWAIVELMGHVRLAGKLTEEEKFGGKLGRLDIPHGDGYVTQYFGAASVYRITLVSEEVARDVCKKTSPAPVSVWDYPKALVPAKDTTHTDALGGVFDDFDVHDDDECEDIE